MASFGNELKLRWERPFYGGVLCGRNAFAVIVNSCYLLLQLHLEVHVSRCVSWYLTQSIACKYIFCVCVSLCVCVSVCVSLTSYSVLLFVVVATIICMRCPYFHNFWYLSSSIWGYSLIKAHHTALNLSWGVSCMILSHFSWDEAKEEAVIQNVLLI